MFPNRNYTLEQAERFRDEIEEERQERYEQRKQRQLSDMAERVRRDPSLSVTEDSTEYFICDSCDEQKDSECIVLNEDDLVCFECFDKSQKVGTA